MIFAISTLVVGQVILGTLFLVFAVTWLVLGTLMKCSSCHGNPEKFNPTTCQDSICGLCEGSGAMLSAPYYRILLVATMMFGGAFVCLTVGKLLVL